MLNTLNADVVAAAFLQEYKETLREKGVPPHSDAEKFIVEILIDAVKRFFKKAGK